MKKYKIVYVLSGNRYVCKVEESSAKNARIVFEMTFPHDDIVSIDEVIEDV